VAEHDLTGTDGLGGDTGIGLKTYPEIRRSAPGACTADDFVSSAERDCGASCACKVLCALGDGTDGGFEVEFSGKNFNLFRYMNGSESGSRMGGIGKAKLAPL
jgi:hypothetical protein